MKIRTAFAACLSILAFATLVLAATVIDLNTASPKDLESLKGVGAVTANKIIAARPYRSVDELSRAGLSAKQIEALRPLVTVGAAAAPAVARPAATAAKAARQQAAAPAVGPLDLNTASEKELEALKGIGPATAKKIVAGRPYRGADDLSKAGLSAKQIAEVKPFVTVAAAAAPVPAAPAVPPAARAAVAKAATVSGPIDLNTASEKDLEALKGVGPATAKKIIAARPLASVDDLARAGVAVHVIAEIRPLVTVTGTAAARPAQARAIPAPAAPTPQQAAAPAAQPVSPAPVAAPPVAAAPAARPAVTGKTVPKLAPGQLVNINTAPKELLDELPGIGPVKAQAIIDGRPYATIEDVMKVKGIKQGEFAKIRNVITVK